MFVEVFLPLSSSFNFLVIINLKYTCILYNSSPLNENSRARIDLSVGSTTKYAFYSGINMYNFLLLRFSPRHSVPFVPSVDLHYS